MTLAFDLDSVSESESFGDRLKRLREAMGLSQEDLGSKWIQGSLGVEFAEKGGFHYMAACDLAWLASALGVTMDYLWRGQSQ